MRAIKKRDSRVTLSSHGFWTGDGTTVTLLKDEDGVSSSSRHVVMRTEGGVYGGVLKDGKMEPGIIRHVCLCASVCL